MNSIHPINVRDAEGLLNSAVAPLFGGKTFFGCAGAVKSSADRVGIRFVHLRRLAREFASATTLLGLFSALTAATLGAGIFQEAGRMVQLAGFTFARAALVARRLNPLKLNKRQGRCLENLARR